MTNNDINNLLTTLRYDTRFKNFTDLKHDSCVQLLQEGSKVASYLVYLLRDYRYNLMHGLIANSLPIWHIYIKHHW